MPIKIPDNLPARRHLEKEGVMLMREADAMCQDIRPLKIGLLNLMPTKQATEIQLSRLIAASPLQVELTLVTTGSYQPKNTSSDHMLDFYKPWSDIRSHKFDGFIVTGAPVETLPFCEVQYWQELQNIYSWTQDNVFQTFNICWGAQASLYHFRGVEKHALPEKSFGIYTHKICNGASALLRGFNDEFDVPVSRYTEVRASDLPHDDQLITLAKSDEVGLCLLQDVRYRQIYMFNHLEYDANTLKLEYLRDLEKGENVPFPQHYFPNDNSENQPVNRWRSHAHLLMTNWINDLYQTTPFNINLIGGAS